MADLPRIVDPAVRRRVMASIRKRDTAPELRVRRALHRQGLRYRVHVTSLPGTPDIVLARAKLVVMVHGCFWHQHPGCRLARRPRSNLTYWGPKLARNIARDHETARLLKQAGWHVLVIWECETKDLLGLHDATARVLAVVRQRVSAATHPAHGD